MVKAWLLAVSYGGSLPFLLQSFQIIQKSCHSRSRCFAANEFEYEYIRPEVDNIHCFPTDLPSSYSDETPAGLRGEAIRSALRSGRCVGWNLGETPLSYGLVKISGRGMRTFLHGKVTNIMDQGFQNTCLLNAKGRMVDRLGIAVVEETLAYGISSPGHSAENLRDYFDKYIFPLDDVSVETMENSCIFSLASIATADVQKCYSEFIVPELLKQPQIQAPVLPETLPETNDFLTLSFMDGSTLLVLPTSGLPKCSGEGYTFAFLNDENKIGERIWRYLISDDCTLGPIHAGALEYDALRIEAGQPAFGFEMTASDDETDVVPAAPLELHYEALLDREKGCYLGQEGVTSMFKNPRGPPRILYHVIFEDDLNLYDFQTQGGATRGDGTNLTRLPQRGDSLFVLGSNEEIQVGTITSVAQPSSTGDPLVLCLALVRRADSVLKQMQQRDLQMPVREMGEDGLIYPPPLDPLDGLEIIIGGTYTIGRLSMVPSRRRKRLYVDDVPEFVKNLPGEDEQNDIIDVSNRDEIQEPVDEEAQLQQAIIEAEAAAAEAKRKEEKLKQLQKRAEEAMARRNQRKKAE